MTEAGRTAPDTTGHGTYWKYSAGCRCDDCREAWRVYTTNRREERKALVAAEGLPPWVEHGASGYNNWFCRCDVCTGGHRRRMARDREWRRKVASRR